MRYFTLILILLCLNISCSRHIENRRWFKRMVECRKIWEYFKLDKPIHGKVLSYAKGICGYFVISSNIIIRTPNGDTIRVLELLCSSGAFKKSDSVLVSVVSKPYVVDGIGDFKFDCKVKKTCYAHITRIQ